MVHMRIAFIGCGYVADYYVPTLALHPELELVAVADRDAARAATFAAHYGLRVASVDAVLRDPNIDLIVNLTSTASHFAVSSAALEAGKHVYSEKPLTLAFPEAEQLVALAAARGLILAGAPSTMLGECAQTLWQGIRHGMIGTPRLVFAELNDGPIHQANFREWRSASGAPWPWADEFATGATLEHAGYYVSWLAAFFGSASRVTSFASTLVPQKAIDAAPTTTPDFSVGCIEYPSGLVARLTCSLMAPRDRSMTVIGDEGTLVATDCWNDGAEVRFTPRTAAPRSRWESLPFVGRSPDPAIPLVREPPAALPSAGGNRMDFARGIAEVAASLHEDRPCRLGADLQRHVTEIVLTLQDPAGMGSPRALRTTVAPIAPMPWAQ
jgi:predicted dehydrogenase